MKKTERNFVIIPTTTVVTLAEQLLLLCQMMESVSQSDKQADKSKK